jgi:hypothetical protein
LTIEVTVVARLAACFVTIAANIGRANRGAETQAVAVARTEITLFESHTNNPVTTGVAKTRGETSVRVIVVSVIALFLPFLKPIAAGWQFALRTTIAREVIAIITGLYTRANLPIPAYRLAAVRQTRIESVLVAVIAFLIESAKTVTAEILRAGCRALRLCTIFLAEIALLAAVLYSVAAGRSDAARPAPVGLKRKRAHTWVATFSRRHNPISARSLRANALKTNAACAIATHACESVSGGTKPVCFDRNDAGAGLWNTAPRCQHAHTIFPAIPISFAGEQQVFRQGQVHGAAREPRKSGNQK